MKNKTLILCALFSAFGVLLPQIFHLFGAPAGTVFLPMHIPVLISGFIVGPLGGLVVGLISPLLSSFITGMPPMTRLPFMVFELMAYGFFSGLIYKYLPRKKWFSLYLSLIGAQLAGRLVNVLCAVIAVYLLGIKTMTPGAVWLALTTGLPGIFIQLISIPLFVKGIQKGVNIYD